MWGVNWRWLGLAAVGLLWPALSYSTETLDPANTYAYLIGFVHYNDPGVPLLDPTNRADIRLKVALKDWGIPEERIALRQDSQAPRATIETSLADFARSIPSGGNLIVYWTGHGYRFGHEAYLLAYDSIHGQERQTGIPTAEIGDIVRKSMNGGKVLFLVDTCHAGAFRQVARGFAPDTGIAAAALTSANLGTTATLAWTFTDALIDAFRGQAWVDENGDGDITFGELTSYVDDTMRFEADELAGGGFSPDFDPNLVLSSVPKSERVSPLDGFHLGEFVQEKTARRRIGQIVGIDQNQLRLVFVDGTKGALPPTSLELPDIPNPYHVGDHLKISGNVATVLKLKLNFIFVHYDGLSPDKDEWRPIDEVAPPAAQ